jgi:hypothetical protein
LDVNGTVRVRTMADIPPSLNGGDKFLYIKPDGTLGKVTITPTTIDGNGDVVITTGSGDPSSSLVTTVDLPNNTSRIDNLDLDLGGSNATANVFIFEGANRNIEIRGITGGTEGRRLYIVNNTGHDIRLRQVTSGIPPSNRFRRFTGQDRMRGGGGSQFGGTAELVWTTQGVGLTEGRWVILSVDPGINLD